MLKPFLLTVSCIALTASAHAVEQKQEAKPAQKSSPTPSPAVQKSSTRPFTGKIVGQHVRMRTQPELESFVVKELDKNELVVIDAETNDFYAIKPPSGIKAYVFRSFVLDNVVEGNRVNVRLSPDLEAPVIGHLASGQHLDGAICEKNHKWLEIDPPDNTRFYISKEFVEYLGGPELKAAYDKRKITVSKLMESAQLLTQSELRKPFEEINLEKLTKNYQLVVNDYSDFPELVEKAKGQLATVNDKYLHLKLAYLEAKAGRAGQSVSSEASTLVKSDSEVAAGSLRDRMKIWEPIEEAIYLAWASKHHSKTMEDFYKDQKLQAVSIAGILEAYGDPVKNKPGDFVIKEKDIPVGYIYSTHLNLENFVGKEVKLLVTPRPNNNFAFPAYYVIGTDN